MYNPKGIVHPEMKNLSSQACTDFYTVQGGNKKNNKNKIQHYGSQWGPETVWLSKLFKISSV